MSARDENKWLPSDLPNMPAQADDGAIVSRREACRRVGVKMGELRPSEADLVPGSWLKGAHGARLRRVWPL